MLDICQGADRLEPLRGRYACPLMNERFSDLLAVANERTVTVRAGDGHPVVKAKLLHAVIAAAAGIVIAPRLTAAAAVGALFKGLTVSVEGAGEGSAAA